MFEFIAQIFRNMFVFVGMVTTKSSFSTVYSIIAQSLEQINRSLRLFTKKFQEIDLSQSGNPFRGLISLIHYKGYKTQIPSETL